MVMEILRDLNDKLTGRVPLTAHRAPGWTKFRNDVLKRHPFCSACPKKIKLEVHHIKPFHLYPSEELKLANVIVLCARCHLLFGHKDNWKDFNLYVAKDAQYWADRVGEKT